MEKETLGYICPITKKQCDDECCVSAEDCHIEASFCIISDCEPSKQENDYTALLKPIGTKQETLEEAFYKTYFGNKISFNSDIGKAFELGAKWQEQKTIEEVFEWLTTNNYLTDLKETLIENFKNK